MFWVIEIDNGEISDYNFRTLYHLKNLNHFKIQIYVEKSRSLCFIHISNAVGHSLDSGREITMSNFCMLEWLIQETNTFSGDHQVHPVNKYGNNTCYYLQESLAQCYKDSLPGNSWK